MDQQQCYHLELIRNAGSQACAHCYYSIGVCIIMDLQVIYVYIKCGKFLIYLSHSQPRITLGDF